MVMGISNEDMEAWARKVCFPQISLLSDWDSHLGTRKNSGSVEPAKKAPDFVENPRDDHYDKAFEYKSYEIIRWSGWSGGGGLGLGHDLR